MVNRDPSSCTLQILTKPGRGWMFYCVAVPLLHFGAQFMLQSLTPFVCKTIQEILCLLSEFAISCILYAQVHSEVWMANLNLWWLSAYLVVNQAHLHKENTALWSGNGYHSCKRANCLQTNVWVGGLTKWPPDHLKKDWISVISTSIWSLAWNCL